MYMNDHSKLPKIVLEKKAHPQHTFTVAWQLSFESKISLMKPWSYWNDLWRFTRKRSIGEEHSSVAFAYNCMAWIRKHQGDLDAAMELLYSYKTAFIYLQRHGRDTGKARQTGRRHGCMFIIIDHQRQICRKSHGEEHSSAIFDYNKMSKILKKQGKANTTRPGEYH